MLLKLGKILINMSFTFLLSLGITVCCMTMLISIVITGWSGQDFSQQDRHQPIEKDASGPIATLVNGFAPEQEPWSVQDLAEFGSIGGLGKVFVGSAATVADELQYWVNETDVDGFNLAYVVAHETFADVIQWLVPELQQRGVYRSAYPEGKTLREKLFGQGPHLPADHPAHQYRDPAQYQVNPQNEEDKS